MGSVQPAYAESFGAASAHLSRRSAAKAEHPTPKLNSEESCSLLLKVALVRPTKSIHDVDLASVKKKMKDKAFARAVNREEIVRGAEQLGTPLDEVITNVIAALKADAARLGLAGVTS